MRIRTIRETAKILKEMDRDQNYRKYFKETYYRGQSSTPYCGQDLSVGCGYDNCF